VPTSDRPTVPTSQASTARVRFLDHGALRVVLLDFHGIVDPPEAFAAVAEARSFIGKLTPDGTHYTLTDVRQTRYDKQIVEAFKDLTAHNRPYVRAAAVISDSALHRAAISMIAIVSRRKLAVFETREAGLEYLAAEDAKARTAARR
jgi:hypothetical protein